MQLNGVPTGLNASLCQVIASVGKAGVKRFSNSVNFGRQTGDAPPYLFCRHFWPLNIKIFYSTLFEGTALGPSPAGSLA